jgi:hypothetical protein
METKDLKKRFKDLTVYYLKLDAVHSLKDTEKMLKQAFGFTIVQYDINGRKVEVVTSTEYGMFIDKLKVGTKVMMTGAEVEIVPEYKGKIWKVEYEPKMMCGEMVVWLDGFRGHILV